MFRWAPPRETPGKPKDALKFLLGAPVGRPWETKRTPLSFRCVPPRGASRKPKGFLWFSQGAHKGDPRETYGIHVNFAVCPPRGGHQEIYRIPLVFAGCSLGRLLGYLVMSSGFR